MGILVERVRFRPEADSDRLSDYEARSECLCINEIRSGIFPACYRETIGRSRPAFVFFRLNLVRCLHGMKPKPYRPWGMTQASGWLVTPLSGLGLSSPIIQPPGRELRLMSLLYGLRRAGSWKVSSPGCSGCLSISAAR